MTDNVLYGDIREPELSKRDHRLVTVAALIASNRPDNGSSRKPAFIVNVSTPTL